MKDYQPLNLTKQYNVGIAFFGSDAKRPIGKQQFHGLPFQIGANPKRCYVGFGGKDGLRKKVVVRIGKKARHVIFAHTVVESKILEGEPVGRVVAHYVFQYHDSTEERVPIRERFEIQVSPTGWGSCRFWRCPTRRISSSSATRVCSA